MPSFLSSDNLGQLAKALAAAQAEMGAAKKDATNPHFKSKYADFAAIVDASRPVMAKHGLAILQSTPSEGATITVATRLIHASGEWIESSLTMTARDATPQSIGSALTYGRRYGWSTLIGLAADEDDDGEKAQPRPSLVMQRDNSAQSRDNTPVSAVAPEGFDAWLAILEATAKDGTEAMRKAWSLSALAFRSHLQHTQRTKVDELKAIAAQHDVLVPELPAEKAGKK